MSLALIDWPKPYFELAGFIALFFSAGAIGFRFAVLRGAVGDPLVAGVCRDAARRAAWLGVLGTLLSAVVVGQRMIVMSGRNHTTLLAAATGTPASMLQIALLALAFAGFLLAARGRSSGWWLALVGVVAGTLRNAFFGQWLRLINPVHELAAGLWIGTLFVMITVGLMVALTSPLTSEQRGAIVARWVNAFSPFALTAAGTLWLFGVITAWRHLKRIESLWTTPYGITLLIKLALVACVFALGWWNWQRVKPMLGSEAGARRLRISAAAEIAVAGAVLIVTSLLVSMPSPR